VSVDISAALVAGENVIAVKAVNEGAGAAGFLAKLVIQRGKDKQEIVSDASWSFSSDKQKDWNTLKPSKADTWKEPVVITEAGKGPWARAIKANTLDNVAELKKPEATPVASMKVKDGFKVELLYSVP